MFQRDVEQDFRELRGLSGVAFTDCSGCVMFGKVVSCAKNDAKHRLANVSQFLTVLAEAISSLSIEVVEDCLVALPIGLALQPARVISYPVLSLTRESTSRP